MDSKEWHLVRRPGAELTATDVVLVGSRVGQPGPGTVLVRNAAMSLEPYLYGRISGQAGHADPYPLGGVLRGPAVGRIIESADPSIPPGKLVLHDAGWRELATVRVEDCTIVSDEVPAELALGVLGLTGMTAWVGVRKIARLNPGETIFVSSAAGAVGSMVVQYAKNMGCTVIASAGSAAKCAMVRSLGADVVFDYHLGSARSLLSAALAQVGGGGIDVYFDNVGGEQLEAAIRELNDFGRIVLCGMTSLYSCDAPQPGPRNLIKIIWRRARMEGFLLRDHEADRPKFMAETQALLAAGAIKPLQSEVSGGIEAAWDGYMRMRHGEYSGKVIVTFDAPV